MVPLLLAADTRGSRAPTARLEVAQGHLARISALAPATAERSSPATMSPTSVHLCKPLFTPLMRPERSSATTVASQHPTTRQGCAVLVPEANAHGSLARTDLRLEGRTLSEGEVA